MLWVALFPILIIVFYPAFAGPFLLDDSSAIQNNSDIRHISLDNLVKIFKGHGNVRGYDHHPVSAMAAMLDYQWSGVDPFGYHISNLIYHWFACGTVLLLFLTVWKSFSLQKGYDTNTSTALWMGASVMFIWSVHPFATMPVAYITCRQETILVTLYMLSLVCVLRGWLAASIFLGIGSFLCKEVAVTLPGAIFLVDWAHGGLGVVETVRKRFRYYFALTSIWLLVCFYHLRGGRRNEIFAAGAPLASTLEYFKAECGVIATYVSKLFWPAKLQFYPYVRPVEGWTEWVPALIVILLYIATAVYCLRFSRWLAVTLIFPLLVLSPTSSVLPIPFEPSMEYRMYLPSVALIGLIVIAIWRWVPKLPLRLAVVGMLMLPLAVVSHIRTKDYKTAMTLYEHDYSIDPRGLNTLEGLAGIYLGAKRYDLAKEMAWKMIDWASADNNKDFQSRGFNSLGLIEFDRKNRIEAKAHFQKAIQISGNWGAKLNLATVHVDLYEIDQAEKLLAEYLVYTPDSPEALLMLYESKMSTKKYDEAEKVFEHFMSIYPERHDLDSQRTRILNLRRNNKL